MCAVIKYTLNKSCHTGYLDSDVMTEVLVRMSYLVRVFIPIFVHLSYIDYISYLSLYGTNTVNISSVGECYFNLSSKVIYVHISYISKLYVMK